jgi:uncharacterized protein YcsI (UPF0317 family)
MTAPGFDTNDPAAVRLAIRERRFTGFTNLVARHHVQGNLMIVPSAYADDFEQYCRRNPQALPLLGRAAIGSPHLPGLAASLDLRTDVGGYMVFRDGVLAATPTDIAAVWTDDLVAFVIGCSFSFETLLQLHGVRLRHLDEGNVSAMYVTTIETVPSGPFGGPLVVSMRALRPADAIRATIVSAAQPAFHGAPVHIGLPQQIGIADLGTSYGGHGLTVLQPDELPVFWACGATAQMAARQAGLPICITHFKAHMVVTDLAIPGVTSSPQA